MLKGKTIIELTDVNTGEKEVIEENNMVTNAINDLFNTFPNLLNSYSIYRGGSFSGYGNGMIELLRLHEFLLGGILLFDSQIEEKPENTYAPASVNLVGCGVYAHQNSTGNRKRGNYNQSESEFNEEQRYMKFVYDFATSEANGTIASVCLTSYMGGCTSYGGKEAEKIKGTSDGYDYTYNFGIRPFLYKTSNDNDYSLLGSDLYRKYFLKNNCLPRDFSFDGNYKQAIADKEYSVLVGAYVFGAQNTYSLNDIYYGEYPIFVDVDEDAVYYLKTKNFKNFWIVKRQAYLKSFSILDCPSFKGNLIEEYELSETTDMYKYYSGRCYCFDAATKCLYIFYNTYKRTSYTYVKANEIIKTVKIDLSDMSNISLQEIDVTNMTGDTLDFYKRRPFVNNGFLYMGNYVDSSYTSTAKPKYFKIEIANPANVSEILYDYTEASYYADDYPVYEHNGIIYMQRGNIIKNDEILKTEFNCFNSFYGGDNRNYYQNYLVPFMINGKSSSFIFAYDGYPRPYNTPTKDNLDLYMAVSGIIYLNNYLATINNLAEPVTKTADKTMKVTYIIQETEPEEETDS